MRRGVALALALGIGLGGVGPAFAQVGIFVSAPGITCKNDTRLKTPVAAQTYCFDATTSLLYLWDGAVWVPMTVPSYTKSSLPAAGTAGRLARVTDDVRGVWMDQGSQWFALHGTVANVKEFGAIGDGVADDTTAVQAAINAVKTLGGVVYAPQGTYVISRLNLTMIDSLIFQGAGKLVTKFMPKAGEASYGSPSGHLFDATNSIISFRDFSVGVFNQTPVPTTAFFLAQAATNASNLVGFRNVLVTGKYSGATVFVYGVASSSVIDSQFYNYVVGTQPIWYFSKSNIPTYTSAFATVTSGSLNTTDWSFFDAELHKFGGNSTGMVIQTDGTGAQYVGDLRFYGGNISGGSQYFLQLDGGPKRLLFSGVTFQTEGEPTPVNLVNIPSGTVDGLAFDQTNVIITGALAVGPGGLAARSSNRQILAHSTPGTALAAGSTNFIGTAGADAAAANVAITVTEKGLLNTLYCNSSASPGGVQTYTITVFVNEAAGALTATITGAVTAANSTAQYDAVAAGDRVTFRVVSSATANTTQMSCTVGLMPVNPS